MAGPILVAYGSRYGATREVAEAIVKTLRRHHVAAEAKVAAEVTDLSRYGGVVLGGGIYMGRWHKDARGFVKRFAEELAELPVALFALGPVDEDAEHWISAEKQFHAAVAKLPVEPFATRLFGGAVDPGKLHFPFSYMPAADVRDWGAVREWAKELAAQIGHAAVLA